ncbi:hypothetical protein [Endozoicomonas atrinae]|uniref:hypothetical protein n=1 Tax=Endozoicomonas atrinae TaxID=1333660 RepID=UPI003AFFF9AD
MEKAWAIIIDDDQAACMMAIPRLFEQLRFPGVFDYEVSETLAAQLWILLCEQHPEFEPWDFPDESQFKNLVEQLIDDWLHQRIPRELTIQQWLEKRQ